MLCRVVVDMGTKQGFKTINTAVGPSIRLAFDVNLDQKFNQLLSPSLNSKHVVSQSAESCKDGVCAAEGATSKMDTKAQQEL